MERYVRDSFQKQIKLYYCGREACVPGHSYGPSIRTHYLMHFILSGQGKYVVDGKVYQVRANQGFLIRPYESTFYYADESDPWEYIWVAFDGGESEQLLEESAMSPEQLVCNFEDSDEARNYMYMMVDCFNRPASFETKQKQRELLGFFYLVFSKITSTTVITYPYGEYELGYLKQAKLFVEDNYVYDIQVQDIAQGIGIERTYLYKIFMKHEKQSPKQYLTSYRLRRAKEMLESTGYKIVEIALSNGFNDSSTFCKNFMASEGVSPSEYRKKRTLSNVD